MGRTEIGSSQIRNSGVKREDIHVSSNVNESLIRKVLAGINMSLTAEPGIASGTGDVTINVVPNPSFSGVITSTVATGTAPFSIASTTMVSNLNADLLDGYHALSMFKDGDIVANTNPFGGRPLYINSINNAAFRAESRWVVTGSRYLIANDSLVATYSQTELSYLFDGNYEQSLIVPVGQYAVININFSTESGGQFPGYPYGDFIISHYYIYHAASMTGRVYCNYAPHGIGWHDLTVWDFLNTGLYTGSLIRKANNYVYGISEVEFKIYAPLSGNDVAVSQIEWRLDRPGLCEMPLLDKYKVNNLYSQLVSKVATGTSPFAVLSTTMVTNLNADLLDGYHASAFQPLLTNPVTGTGTQNYVAKWNNAGGTTIGNSVIYDDGTNVGIGTTHPSAPLQINFPKTVRDQLDDVLVLSMTTPSVSPPYTPSGLGILFRGETYNNIDVPHARIYTKANDSSGSALGFDLRFQTTLDNAGDIQDRITIRYDGNVGIGTTLPADKLDVVGNLLLGADYPAGGARTTLTNKSSFICYPHYDNTEEKVIGFYGYSGSGSSSVVFGGGSSGHNAVTLLAFYTAATSTTLGGSERMRISSDGKVSIGTSNAVSLLTVNGDVLIGSDATFWAGDDYKLRIKGTNQGFAVNTNLPVSVSTGLAFSIGIYGEGYARTNFYSSGNVGWGSGIATRDTFLGRVAASTLGVFGAYDGTGSSDFVVSGKVGIGQTNPSLGRLEINRASGEYGSTYPFVVKRYNGSEAVREYMDGVWNYYIDSSNAAGTNSNIYLYGKGTGYVLIPSGRLGIGITGPTEKLHVNGNIRVTGAYYDSSNNPGTSGQILKSTATGTDWVSLNEIAGVDGTGTANYFTKWIDADTIGNSQISENSTNKYIDFNWRSISKAIVWPNLYDTRQSNYNAFLNAGDCWVNIVDRGANLAQYTGRGAIATVEVYRTGFTTSTVINGGSGYSVNDVLTVTGGNGAAQVRVDTIDGSGKALTLTVVNGGANYYTGSNISTTGGTGTGCKLYIKSVSGNARAGTSANGGSINTLFRSPTQAYLYWSSVSSTNPVELTLDWSTLGQMHIYRFMMVPASRNQMPISYKVEVYTNDSYYGYDRWHEHYNVTGETSTYLKMVNFSNSPTESLLAIRITVYEAGDLDQTGYLSLQNIIGYERYIGGGRFTGYNLGVSGDVAYGGYTFYPALNSPIPITLKGSDSTVLFRIQESTSAANYLDVSNVSMLAYRGTGSNSGFTFVTQNAGSWGAGADAGCFIFKPNNVEGLRILKHGTLTQSITGVSEYEALRTNLKNVQTTGLGAMWSVYANTDTSADFFGKTGFKFVGGTTDTYKQWHVYVSNSSTPKIVLNNSGYLGIGCVDPKSMLHIEQNSIGNLVNNLELRNINTTNNSSGVSLSLHPTTAGWGSKIFTDRGTKTGYAGSLAFGVTATQSAEEAIRLLIRADTGNIGIGTINPLKKLHIEDIANDVYLRLKSTTSRNLDIGMQTNGVARIFSNDATLCIDSSSAIYIQTVSNANTILNTAGGNVGINTASPTRKLSVYGGSGTVPTAVNYDLIAAIGDAAGIRVVDNDSSDGGMAINGGNFRLSSSGKITFAVNSTVNGELYNRGTEALTILSSGAVGVNNASPGYNLDVSGSIRMLVTSGSITLGYLQAQYPYNRLDSWSSNHTGYLLGFGYQKTDGTNKKIQFFTKDTERGIYSADALRVITFTANEMGGSGFYPAWATGILLLASGSSYFNGGNVGIGTTTPQDKLEVAGNIRLYNIAADNEIIFQDQNISHGMTALFSEAGGNSIHARIMALDGANGGIDLVGATDADGSAGARLYGVLGVTDPTDSIPAVIIKGAKKSTTDVQALGNTETVLQVQNNTSALMTILGSGYVGIGLAYPQTPQAPLNLFKAPTSGFVEQLRIGGLNNYRSLDFGTWGSYGGYISTYGNDLYILAGRGVATENHNIHFYTSFSGTGGAAESNERMTIAYDGRIGIGITSSIPATLSIKSYGSTNATKAFFIKNSSDTELFTIYDDGSMSIPGSIIGLRGYSEQIEIQDDGTYSIALTYAPKGIQYIHLCKNGMTLRRTIDYVVYNSSYLNLTGTADYFNTDDDVYVEYYY